MKQILILFVFFVIHASHAVYAADPSVSLLKNQAKEAFLKQDFRTARDLYSQALAIDPNPELYRNRGIASVQCNDLAQAESDFKKVLDHDSRDPKALYGLGKIAFQQSFFAKSIHFLQQILDLEKNVPAKTLLLKAENQFASRVTVYDLAPVTPFQKLESDTKKALKFLGIMHFDKLHQLCYETPFSTDMMSFLEHHWIEKKFVPLNRSEYPQGIANLLGKGQRLATVIVQTTPIRCSENFNHVDIFDTSKEQINFNNLLISSLKVESLDTFLHNAKQEFNNYVVTNKHKDPYRVPTNQAIESHFKSIYDGLSNIKLKSNINAQHMDIFEAVNKEE